MLDIPTTTRFRLSSMAYQRGPRSNIHLSTILPVKTVLSVCDYQGELSYSLKEGVTLLVVQVP